MSEPHVTARFSHRPAPRTTLAHVAERAGVSIATASLVLSGRNEYITQFRPDTVEKVRCCAERLGDRVNLFAAGLPTKTSLFFLLVIRDFGGSQDPGSWHLWAFEGMLLAGAMRMATDKGLYPVVVAIDPTDPEAGIAKVDPIISGGVLGAIVRTPQPPLERVIRSRLKAGQRLVVVFPHKLSAWPTNAIDVDNMAIGETAGRLLTGRRRRTLAFVCYKSIRHIHRLRIEGLKLAAEEVGATVAPIQLPLAANEQSVAGIVASRIKRVAADGLFAVDSVSSVGSLIGLMRCGMKPTEDFDLVGCDCSLWRSESMPAITTVDVSWEEVGRLATKKLLDMSRAGSLQFETIVLPPRVTPADTCPVPEGFEPVTARQ
ncbi:MAG: substrate-binding domain-containing protein [Phycisphaerae bacterium]